MGVETVRLRLALLDSPISVAFPHPEIAIGFIRDWLNFSDREARNAARRWQAAIIVSAALAAGAVITSAWPYIVRAF